MPESKLESSAAKIKKQNEKRYKPKIGLVIFLAVFLIIFIGIVAATAAFQIKYNQKDPNNVIVVQKTEKKEIAQTESNIYDPRFTGYGTGYRSYTDKLNGQPKFFYKDIDAITMPNYISRSNVDIFPWSSKYGPDVDHSETNGEYRQLANNAFLDSALTFRTELQERLMRKRNAEMWQLRVAPIITNKK